MIYQTVRYTTFMKQSNLLNACRTVDLNFHAVVSSRNVSRHKPRGSVPREEIYPSNYKFIFHQSTYCTVIAQVNFFSVTGTVKFVI